MAQTGFSIRTSTAQDLAAVTDLLQASYPLLMKSAYDPAMLEPALKLMSRANPKLLTSGTYFVAESQGGAIVGCGGWTHERPGTDIVAPGIAHVRHFGTHPNWIRRGIGRAIFARCKDDARPQGIREFECYSSLNAEPFYAALGFERISLEDIELTPAVSLRGCLMRCRI